MWSDSIRILNPYEATIEMIKKENFQNKKSEKKMSIAKAILMKFFN